MKLWRWRCGGLLDGEFLDAAPFCRREMLCTSKVRASGLPRLVHRARSSALEIFSVCDRFCHRTWKNFVSSCEISHFLRERFCHGTWKTFCVMLWNISFFTWKILSCAIKDGWWFQGSFVVPKDNKRRVLWKIKCTSFCWNVTCDDFQTHLNDKTLVAEDTKFAQDAWFCCR